MVCLGNPIKRKISKSKKQIGSLIFIFIRELAMDILQISTPSVKN